MGHFWVKILMNFVQSWNRMSWRHQIIIRVIHAGKFEISEIQIFRKSNFWYFEIPGMIQNERFWLILNFRLHQDSLNLVIWISKILLYRADVMGVESKMIVLRTHLIFPKVIRDFKVFSGCKLNWNPIEGLNYHKSVQPFYFELNPTILNDFWKFVGCV